MIKFPSKETSVFANYLSVFTDYEVHPAVAVGGVGGGGAGRGRGGLAAAGHGPRSGEVEVAASLLQLVSAGQVTAGARTGQ